MWEENYLYWCYEFYQKSKKKFNAFEQIKKSRDSCTRNKITLFNNLAVRYLKFEESFPLICRTCRDESIDV